MTLSHLQRIPVTAPILPHTQWRLFVAAEKKTNPRRFNNFASQVTIPCMCCNFLPAAPSRTHFSLALSYSTSGDPACKEENRHETQKHKADNP